MKKNQMLTIAAMAGVGFGMYKYYMSHSKDIKCMVKSTMKKVRHSMEEMEENMM